MQTLDQSLANLVKEGVVRYQDALERAGNVQEFKALCEDKDPGSKSTA